MTTNISSNTQVPKDTPAPWSSEGLGTGSIFTILPFAIFFLLRAAIRRFIRDGVEVAKDRAETDIVQVLREDNAKLRESYDKIQEERNQAVSQLGKFIAETESYKVKVEELQSAIGLMTAKLEEQNKLLQDVLMENSQLKSQVNHLAEINNRLEVEVKNLDAIVNKMVDYNNAKQDSGNSIS